MTRAALARGALAGAAGGAAMSASTSAEMRIRGREPSRVPARAVERLLGVEVASERAEALLVTLGHWVTSVVLGTVRGLLDRAGLGPGAATAAFAGVSLLPDLVLLPATGAAEPPWRWPRRELAITALHHGVYAAATSGAYEWLRRRG